MNVQFMVKDTKNYAATGGWGYADFTHGKPGNEAFTRPATAAKLPKDRELWLLSLRA